MGFSSGGGGAPSSPVNLVTTAPNPVLANKLASGDAQPAWEIFGSGVLAEGPGGGAGLDSQLGRVNGGNGFQIGQGNNGDIAIVDSGGGYLTTVGTDNMRISTNGNGATLGNLYLTLTGGAIQAAGTIQNKVAGNEVATATAGGGAAVPATVLGFLVMKNNAGTIIKFPFFAA